MSQCLPRQGIGGRPNSSGQEVKTSKGSLNDVVKMVQDVRRDLWGSWGEKACNPLRVSVELNLFGCLTKFMNWMGQINVDRIDHFPTHVAPDYQTGQASRHQAALNMNCVQECHHEVKATLS